MDMTLEHILQRNKFLSLPSSLNQPLLALGSILKYILKWSLVWSKLRGTMNTKAENDQRSECFTVPQSLAMRQHSEHPELFTAIKAESFLPLCQNHCITANCKGFWMKEIIVTNNGTSALLHKWPWSPTLLVRITAPMFGLSLVSSASTKSSLREECRNNSTVIDNIIELWECHKAQCQQSVPQSISIPHSNERTGWKRKN